jgi:hypothetical protein
VITEGRVPHNSLAERADIDATTDFYIRVFGMKAAPSAFPLARGREPKIHYLSKDSGGGKEPFQEPM